MAQQLNDYQLAQLFQDADKDANGHLSLGEIILFFRRCGLQVSQTRCFEIMDKLDMNPSGKNEFDLYEFKKLFRTLFPNLTDQPVKTDSSIKKLLLEQSEQVDVLSASQRVRKINDNLPKSRKTLRNPADSW